MKIDLVLEFGGKLCHFVKWFLVFFCVCISRISVQGESVPVPIVITGEVRDVNGVLLPGVTIVLKGTSLGCATDANGKFRLEIPERKEIVLLFRFVGMKNQEITVTRSQYLRVTMEKDMKELEDVVVTGYYTQAKNAFTGEITVIKGEDLLRVAPTSLLQALAILTPGLRIVENNEAGSNPNVVPEILIRGASSIMTKEQEGVNAPLIILDGIKVSVEDLYDLDIYDIEQILVLKDASAAVLYGEKAQTG